MPGRDYLCLSPSHPRYAGPLLPRPSRSVDRASLQWAAVPEEDAYWSRTEAGSSYEQERYLEDGIVLY